MVLVFLALVLISGAVHVNVMLPLNTVNLDGSLNKNLNLGDKFQQLHEGGVHGVMVDVWWGIAEREGPKQYDFHGYLDLMSLASQYGLKVQAVMSFHRCGGNVGDDCNIPLPGWVVRTGGEIWYKDREGHQDQEYLSLGVDNEALFVGRTPIQMYRDFMQAFRDTVSARGYLVSTLEEVQVGLGPCGELRYPSYQLDRWSFPGVGEFQCYDARMLRMMAAAANASGHPDWTGPPGDAGTYNSRPDDTNFFRNNGGGWNTEYGRFFLGWYSQALVDHGRNVLKQARTVFGGAFPIAAKVAGIHWWFLSTSHAAELTAGYYETRMRSGYKPILQMFKEYGVILDFTCFEMADQEQPSSADCGPFELVGQTLDEARAVGIGYASENALPRYDDTAYSTILYNARRILKISGFTYLRLTADLLSGANWSRFRGFVSKMAAL